MSWAEMGSADTKATAVGFLDAIEIWRKKPHVANRRLCGTQILWSETIQPSEDCTLDECVKQLHSLCKLLLQPNAEPTSLELCVTLIRDAIGRMSSKDADNSGCSRWMVTVRSLIQKHEKKNVQKIIELLIIDKVSLDAVFLPICGIDAERNVLTKVNDFAYKVSLDQSSRKLYMYSCDMWNTDLDLSDSSYTTVWLTGILLKKLARWAEEEKLNTEVTSLRLVNIDRYVQIYNELKTKYGKHFVEIWPEQTDPSKFVYEDIGIAAYLLVLWEKERNEKGLTNRQSFVDIGCGNGLLVYLLTAEGHPGMGVDVRKRKIWDLLSDVADLKEHTVNPSDNSVFPNHDWLIGNHSDELTPWIPVIAARSHHNCRYFVLPCCAWDFGEKFSCNSKGQNSGSQYHTYLQYVEEVGQMCGFNVQRDTLRIPSTKRVCFIGGDRSYPATDEAEVDLRRKKFIEDRSRCKPTRKRIQTERGQSSESADEILNELDKVNHGSEHDASSNVSPHNHSTSQCVQSEISCTQVSSGESAAWLETFQPRSATEKPKNAVCIEQSVKDHIAVTVLKRILQATEMLTLADGRMWNKGGIVSLNEVSQLFDREVLLKLKNECGGLQTLLKNCPDVFLVRGGNIGLRDWTSEDYLEYRSSRNKKRPKSNSKAVEMRKTKQCFFFQNHPDGCPLEATNCRFAHGTEDIKN